MVFALAGDSTITSCIVVWDVPEVWALRVYVRIRAKMGFGLEGRQASLLRVKLRMTANDPIADIPERRDGADMRCFYVLVHGRLRWLVGPTDLEGDVDQPAGLYCHRYVLASDRKAATQRAFDSVSANLDRQTGWLRDQAVELELEAEEVSQTSLLKAFSPVNRGHTFYESD